MRLEHRKRFRALAIFIAFGLVQVSFQSSFAAPLNNSLVPPQQGILGRLSIKGNSPVTVNGNNAVSGDSITPGSIVETSAGTEATISLGVLGSLELARGTKVKVDFGCPSEKLNNPDPESCRATVTVFTGCVVSNYNQGTRSEIDDANQNRKASSDREKERSGGGSIRTCGGPPPVSEAGLSRKGLFAILTTAIGASVAIAIILATGDNPSPSGPT